MVFIEVGERNEKIIANISMYSYYDGLRAKTLALCECSASIESCFVGFSTLLKDPNCQCYQQVPSNYQFHSFGVALILCWTSAMS